MLPMVHNGSMYGGGFHVESKIGAGGCCVLECGIISYLYVASNMNKSYMFGGRRECCNAHRAASD